MQDRAQHIAHSERYITAQADSFRLNVDSSVSFPEEPVAIHAPEQTAVLADRQFTFSGLTRVAHLGNPLAVRAAVDVRGIELDEVNLVFAIQHGGYKDFAFTIRKYTLKSLSCRDRIRAAATSGR